MADKNIKVMESLTKDQEIKLINDFYNALPQDSYLKEIMVNLPDYLADQIRNDWTICPLETINGLQAGLDEKDKTIKQLEEKAAEYEKLFTGSKAKLEISRDNLQKAQEELAKKQEEAREQRLRAAGAEMEVIELKAKLYDYMVGNNK